MVLTAGKKKARIKAQLEREWGQPAHMVGNDDLKYGYAESDANKLRSAGFRAVALGSIRQEYANRDYYNVWTTCPQARKYLRG